MGPTPCLGHTREDRVLPGMLTFNNNPLGATFKESPDPVMDWTSYSVKLKLTQKSVVWHSVKRLAEIKNSNIHLLLFQVLTSI